MQTKGRSRELERLSPLVTNISLIKIMDKRSSDEISYLKVAAEEINLTPTEDTKATEALLKAVDLQFDEDTAELKRLLHTAGLKRLLQEQQEKEAEVSEKSHGVNKCWALVLAFVGLAGNAVFERISKLQCLGGDHIASSEDIETGQGVDEIENLQDRLRATKAEDRDVVFTEAMAKAANPEYDSDIKRSRKKKRDFDIRGGGRPLQSRREGRCSRVHTTNTVLPRTLRR